jgi:hypothetical protein
MNLESSTHLLMSLNPASNGAIILQKNGQVHIRSRACYTTAAQMKRLSRPATILTISLLIALFGAAVTFTTKISGSGYPSAAVLFLQTTPTPTPEEDHSVVGSTDGIVVMGGVITAIILIPILAKRKSWMPTN